MNNLKETVREAFKQAQSQENRAKTQADPGRLAYHLMPPVGWLNDPNGLYEKDGIYHIFYQYTPMNADGSTRKGWGHYTTSDFVHFKEEDVPLFPDSEDDKGGAYSGSAFEHDGTIHFFYTGNDKLEGNYDYVNEGRKHYTCHFTTKDGKTFSDKEVLMKNADYPADLSCHVRDPKVIEQDGKFYMVEGARTRDSKGLIQLFESDDLQHWKPSGRIVPAEDFGFMWECPDLFDLGGQRFLITCPQGVDQDGYRYESLYQNGYYTTGNDLSNTQVVDEFTELDHGFDFYAPQTFEDEKGRRILIGWMGLPDVEYDNNPTIENGWQHALTLPRELTNHNGKLYQYPIEETLKLRDTCISTTLKADEAFELPTQVCEIELYPQSDSWHIDLRHDVTMDFENGVFTFAMKESGHKRDIRHIEIAAIDRINIFSDTTSLEIFLNEGQEALTTRIYDDPQDLTLKVSAEMKAEIWELDSYQVEYKTE